MGNYICGTRTGLPGMFHSPAAWIEFVWQLFVLVVSWLIIINSIQTGVQWWLLAIFSVGVVVNVIFYLWNLGWKGGSWLRMKNKPKKAVRAYLEFHNDYWHFSWSISLHAFLLLFLVIGIITKFHTGDLDSPESQLILKFFAVAAAGMSALLCGLFLNTHVHILDQVIRKKFVLEGLNPGGSTTA